MHLTAIRLMASNSIRQRQCSLESSASKTIPLANPKVEYLALKSSIDAAIAKVMESGSWIQGAQTRLFERSFAKFIGCDYCLGVGNGTDALEIALRACNVKVGDEVVTTANAGGYAATAIRLVGAIPAYVDVEPDFLTMDITQIPAILSERTRAIIATHLYGNVVDVRALQESLGHLGRQDIKIVEDCAQAHGAQLQDRKTGSLGDVATFSFYPTKNLGAVGDAGALLTNDSEICERIRMLHQYGWRTKYRSELTLGRNSRMDEIQAAVLNVKLPLLEKWTARRRMIASQYRNALSPCLRMPSSHQSVYHLCVVMSEHRIQFINHLQKAGISHGIHYPVLDCDQKAWQALDTRQNDDLPISRRSAGEVVSIPGFPGLTDSQVGCIAEAIQSFRR